MIKIFIKEGEKVSRGYLPVGISMDRLGYEVALPPFHWLFKWYRKQWSMFEFEKREELLMAKLGKRLDEEYKRGYEAGTKSKEKEIIEKYLKLLVDYQLEDERKRSNKHK